MSNLEKDFAEIIHGQPMGEWHSLGVYPAGDAEGIPHAYELPESIGRKRDVLAYFGTTALGGVALAVVYKVGASIIENADAYRAFLSFRPR